MLAHRKQRLMIVLFIVLGSALAVSLMLFALNKGINVFFTPAEVADGMVAPNQNIRIGGMVKEGSVDRTSLEGTTVQFIATDYIADVPVMYTGVLPDLFREGQGVVAEGVIDENGVLQANKILARHDENYMSAEVKEALDRAERRQAAEAAMASGRE